MDFKYTRHQIPRSTRPDAETADAYCLIKNVSQMHATYQVRLLAYFAATRGRKLVIRVPSHCRSEKSLNDFIETNPNLVFIERV